MKSLTPLVQVHNKIALDVKPNDCEADTFVQIDDDVLCDITKLKLALQRQTPAKTNLELYDFDHVYPGSQNNTIVVILYGQLGTQLFNQYHNEIKARAEAGDVKYIIRNYLSRKDTRRVRLSGYGVELHLKSTEYKSQDDSPKSTQETSVNQDDDEELEIEGVNFKILK